MIYTQEIANHDLLRLDRAHVWHPYTSFTQPGMVTAVSHAQGVKLHLADGRVLIDGMSSWWSTLHGCLLYTSDAADDM
jgi:adenosylmethionine-8-amino-7-oxononanoate aminotransferase